MRFARILRCNVELAPCVREARMKFLNTEHVLPAMKHCVAIGANGAKVGDGIEFILTIRERERLEVMNMNEVLSDLAIPCLKVEAAHSAVVAMMR